MIALIRGGKSNFPCPTCLVPKDEIPNLSKRYTRRTSATMEKIWMDAQELNKKDCEALLKAHGLHNVKVGNKIATL